MQTIKPNKTQIFARLLEVEAKTKSGILLTDNSKEKPQVAEVINIGSAVTEYSAKDSIVFKEYASSEIKLDGNDYLLIDEKDVLGKVVEV